jgi:endoglucanase
LESTVRRFIILLAGFVLSLGATGIVYAAEPDKNTFAANRLLGRGVNFGNTLEAPREGEWGLTLEADYFKQIREAGFNSVRIPIRWSAHAGAKPPYTIHSTFYKRVDWAIEQALSHKLAVVINVHHYDELYREPEKHFPRLLVLWKQIAEHYRTQPDRLIFELLNEPNGKLTDERWQQMITPLLEAIRASNPRRMVIVGPGHWNNLDHLEKLHLPEEDRRLIVTFHYYSPFEFTHQGALWAPGSQKWKGTTWTDTPEQRAKLQKDLAKASEWAKKHQRPLYLGEFGAYSQADMDSRARWTRAVARVAEKHGMSWAYWEFGAGFGVYDPKAQTWRRPLLEALLDRGAP